MGKLRLLKQGPPNFHQIGKLKHYTTKMKSELKQRFEKALNSNDSSNSLWELAHGLRDEGLSQIELYLLYDHYHQLTDSEDAKYDAIIDSMDIIWGGGWAKGQELYTHELTGQEIKKI